MKNYTFDDKYHVNFTTATKGTQPKWFDGEYYYKQDLDGNEGLVEALAAEVLSLSTLDKKEYVVYKQCLINGKKGCRSRNFADVHEEFITMSVMYSVMTGYRHLSNRLFTINTAKERLDYILDIANGYGVDRHDFKHYLNVMLQLDLLIENTDRHEHNYGVMCSPNKIRIAPVFDNGRSLSTVDGFAACTISGSFTDQILAFGFPYKSVFRVDYNKLYDRLSKYGSCKEVNLLKKNLEKYKYIFSD